MRSTPTAGMKIIIGLRPISVFYRKILLRVISGLKGIKKWRTKQLNKHNRSCIVEGLTKKVDEA